MDFQSEVNSQMNLRAQTSQENLNISQLSFYRQIVFSDKTVAIDDTYVHCEEREISDKKKKDREKFKKTIDDISSSDSTD